MTLKQADLNPNYQQRAQDFAVGDTVVPYGHRYELAGVVKALYPAIGMVDVEFPQGSKRYPVEDLQRLDPSNNNAVLPPASDSIPGGIPVAPVSGGPSRTASSHRVARAFIKKSLYWHSNDRLYRATTEEVGGGTYLCPKCRVRGEDCYLKPAVYKRREGKSERLLGCPNCLFLIKRSDIVNDPVVTAQAEG